MLSLKHYRLVILFSIRTLLAGSSIFPPEQLRSQQGSTCKNHASNHAHDNRFETFSCSLNNQIYGLEGPWWEGDLGSKRTIIGIKVFSPRQKYYFTLLENYKIYICNDTIITTKSISNCSLCAQGPRDHLPRGESIEINCYENIVGRYILLFKQHSGEFSLPARQLAIAEIRIRVQ